MSTVCLTCVKNYSASANGSASLKARAVVTSSIKMNLIGTALISGNHSIKRLVKSKFNGEGAIKPKTNMTFGLHSLKEAGEANIHSNLKISHNATIRITGIGNIANIKADKFGGSISKINNIDNFQPSEKLYPIKDIVTNYNNSYFINKYGSPNNLYSNIDEGVFTGNLTKHGKISHIISDEKETYIHPSSIFTSGDFRYKFEVTTPLHNAKESFLFIRAAAPVSNYSSDVPPQYKIHNIKLEDPSGNLIVQYKDIIIRGDADYSTDYVNFATYISEPEVNNLLLYSWQSGYPIMGEPSGYTLNLDFNIQCLDDPFSEGFNKGYEDTCKLDFVNNSNNDYLSIGSSPLSTQNHNFSLNPTNSLRISAIEICNSGGIGILTDNYLRFYSEVSSIGQRISRNILPVELLTSEIDLGIYPASKTIWTSSPDSFDNYADNTSASGANVLAAKLQDDSSYNYITLTSTDPINDSGRLTVKFSHKPPTFVRSYADGEFSFGGPSKDFNTAEWQSISETDSFFVIDSLELRVVAKKTLGSRDYALDIVGYSDDRILNITPKVGAFLQNDDSGIGSVPSISGFNSVNDLGISTESISDKNQYFESTITTNEAGDHYKLSSTPVVSSTSFAEYSVPLKIYKDNVELGKSIDYSMSSYFENLYFDIYPLPSGATISTVQLIVHYKPSNGLMLHTIGQQENVELARRNIKIFPSPRQLEQDTILNSDISEGPLSLIENIPHSFKSPTTLKTNYSRRWRGVDGIVVDGPYDPNQFDFSFYNPELNTPFLNGYYTFNNDIGNIIISDSIGNNTAYSGIFNGTYQKTRNIGLRFNNQSLFNESTNYTTIDWTSLSGYENSELYGKIIDAYDNVIRVSGEYGNINFGNIDTVSGFSIYTRFSPDISISGVGYNLFNSGVLFSKWDDSKQLEFALGYQDGYLCGYARVDGTDDIVQVIDTIPYSAYQYPLSVLLTYNDNLSNKLKLYTVNEIDDSNILKSESDIEFILASGSSDFVVGNCGGSGIGINAFVSEIGISTYNASGTNILTTGGDRLFRQTTAESFLLGHSHTFLHSTNNNNRFKLWDYVNEDTSLWKLGDFQICSFSADFDSFTKREGNDFISHRLKHSGSGYLEVTNLALPSSIYASGLSYHSQIENDFLRFNLSDIPDGFDIYSTYPRISKNLPRGYHFDERAIVVETIVEYNTFDNITWNDGSIGPKLIVSLYTKNQDPIDRPSKINWGLINRSTHNLKPSGCYNKLSSTFNYNDLIDTTEPWASFDIDRVRTELDHKYYSKDINDMFLQYDLVYPSGNSFDSTVKIHSSHIRLENALVKANDINNTFNLIASGEKTAISEFNLYTTALDVYSDSNNLFIEGDYTPATSSIMNLYASGANVNYASLNLYTVNVGAENNSMPIYVGGRYNKFDDKILNLVTHNLLIDQTKTNSLSFFTRNVSAITPQSNSFNLSILGSRILTSSFVEESVNLSIEGEKFTSSTNNDINLYLQSESPLASQSASCSLYTINYPAFNQEFNQQAYISWNSQNIGQNITTADNDYAFLEANDEIRGVDLICYGSCGTTDSCTEESVNVHEIAWSVPSDCVDGGIIRAKNTYTNLEASGFKTEVGYSGNFYGIRKYTDLIPNAPYNIVVAGRTGNNTAITLPVEFNEIEYGSNDYVAYSGTKLVNDNSRQSGDKYGKSIAVKGNLMAVGAPMRSVEYSEYDSSGNLITSNLEKAGTVFLYRREDRPVGDWPIDKDKSPWNLELELTLPSGLLKDYYTTTTTNNIGGIVLPLPITERHWQVGQEGREFGHSVDIGINNSGEPSFGEDSRQIVVVGGPSSKWSNRSFDELQSSGVQIGLLIFTDEFQQTIYRGPNQPNYSYLDILNSISNKDLIFQYFSNPSVKFDVKVIICEPIADYTNRELLDFSEPKPSFIVKKRIARNQGFINQAQSDKILSGIKDAFHTAFPYDENKLNNNIPVMLGIYVDQSRSLGKQALNPSLNDFISYYQDYSYASGLVDFYGVRSSGAVITYDAGRSENWITATTDILNNVLDTGRLVSNNQVRFFTSGVGSEAFNANLSQFNYPPDSGGKVFIFEKESGSWNLIQEIKSSNLTYGIPDRFGHAVAISDNTEVIGIGSPYIGNSCQIYEYKSTEKQRLYNSLSTWVSYKSSAAGGIGYYSNLLTNFNSWISQYGYSNASRMLYANLTSTEKFEARQYLNIKEYQNIYTYGQPSVIGDTWRFIVENFAPTSRLGYSVAVNDDGSIVAFGAPTDSLNQWDDGNVYYKNQGYKHPVDSTLDTNLIQPSWRSNVNAGAVRLFESRKYYPHNSVVEYGKFGNLGRSISTQEDANKFTYLANIFHDKNFNITEFTDVKIPQEAGLAFVITPEIDAVSEEVINNIIDWLSLGDRNLVLVGNDPVWESSGVYASSNAIINKILSALDSRMKIVPARNAYEALSSGCSNAIPSFIPAGSTQSYTTPLSVPAYGVADIRTNFNNIKPWNDLNLLMPCTSAELNSKCELSIRDGGDLRAQWMMTCLNCNNVETKYPVNLAYLFKTITPNCCEPTAMYLYEKRIDLSNQEPVPLLVAATNVTETTIIPAVPAVSGVRPIYEPKLIKKSSKVISYDDGHAANEPALIWNSGNATYSNITYNINNSNSASLFYTPTPFEGRQAILQANAHPEQEIVQGNQIVSPVSYYCVEENLGTSKIIGIAGLFTESANILYTGSSEDKNLNFYLNLVSKTTTANGGSNIAQLGSWTGRATFKDAFSNSILYEVFRNGGNEVRLNANKLYASDNICWIANPTSLPSEDQLIELQSWINLGNKKVIITYDSSISQVSLITKLFGLLNSNIKPLYLTVKDTYATSATLTDLVFNTSHPISTGYDNDSSITHLISKTSDEFTPLQLLDGIVPICYSEFPVFDYTFNTAGYWKLDSGITKVSFPAINGSGYKIFIETVSETPSDNQQLSIYVTNVNEVPALPYPTGELLQDSVNNYYISNIGKTIRANSTYKTSFNAQVLQGKSTIDFYISSYIPRLNTVTNAYLPKTTRLLSISGVAVPIIQTIVPENYTINTVVGYEDYRISEPQPERILTTTRFKPISNLNDQYCAENCDLGNQYINDGPVIAAQEVEHITSFNVGMNRSRITLLSDASLVQGDCIADEFGRLSANTVQFIRSLYPNTIFPNDNSGRQFNVLTKIVSPERGSPQKYHSILNNGGLNIRFNGNGFQKPLSSFGDKESKYDPRYVIRPPEPWEEYDDEETKQSKKQAAISNFLTEQVQFGGSAKFSGIIDGKLYADAPINGGMPEIMKDNGYDYLDLDHFASGYPGDLFGYSIALYKNKLVVGSPFAGFSQQEINPWSYYVNNSAISGVELSYNGGAGAAYVFEQTYKGSGLHGSLTPWEFIQKLRPSSIHVGHDLISATNSEAILGYNNYTDEYLAINSFTGDKFGSDVDIDADIIAVGAPGHDFGNLSINGTGEFIRKSFNAEFNIPSRTTIDCGLDEFLNSGVPPVLNNGAIFTFENRIIDWPTKTQKWTYVEKIVPQGILSRDQNFYSDSIDGGFVGTVHGSQLDVGGPSSVGSPDIDGGSVSGTPSYMTFAEGNENDNFGQLVSIDRANRSDADYTIVGGSYKHGYSSSGTNLLVNAGAIYSNDIMLRPPVPVLPNSGTYIDAKVFGERDGLGNPTVNLYITNNNDDNKVYYSSGIVYSNNNGEIFIEISGQDPSSRGFITHRPFIESVDGQYAYGIPIKNSFRLYTAGRQDREANMDMFTKVDNSSFVYNSIGLYNSAILGFASGIPSGLSLYLDCPEPVSISASGLFLYTASGIGNYTDTLNLRIRGK